MCAAVHLSAAPRRFAAGGMVVAVDAAHHTLTVSHGEIPGYMGAMTMPFDVRDPKQLAGLHPGDTVAFTLVVSTDSSWLEAVRAVPFESAERDPSLAERLRLLDSVMTGQAANAGAVGSTVPDFTLTDQNGDPVTLSKFRGKVVALNFIYTRCPLPDYCFRLSNNFARLRKRFAGNRDLILLTVTFDPVHDGPEALARYAQTWKADSGDWHFLTGREAEVRRVCSFFGVQFWRDDGFLTHSLHTAVIARDGTLLANVEGNKFTAAQLGDLVEQALRRR